MRAVFEKAGRGVPVFNDKHLSYRWDWAKEMVDTARAMKFPLMAGSSVPLAQRRPPLELPANASIVEAVSIHGGGAESYDFHALEVMQIAWSRPAPAARRACDACSFWSEPALWQAANDGLWSAELAAAAMAAEVGADHELVKLVASRGKQPTANKTPVHGILVHYRDGLRGTALKVGNERHSLELRLPAEGPAEAGRD